MQNILHLATGDGREIPHIMQLFPRAQTYIINDAHKPTLDRVIKKATTQFPSAVFQKGFGDIELPQTISLLRKDLQGPTLIVLTGNSVLFSNRKLDHHILRAMQKDDRFLLTLETPHRKMFNSYTIEPVFKLLSNSGIVVTKDNAKFCYDETDQCMKISCEGKVLLSSYKPNPDQLRGRMTKAGFAEVVLEEYPNLHMIGSLWKRK